MRLKFSVATILALAAGAGAFVAPALNRRATSLSVGSGWDNEDFLKSLTPPNDGDAYEKGKDTANYGPKPGDEEVGQGGSRFQEIMDAAKAGKEEADQPPKPVDNPFLTPPPSAQPATATATETPPVDPDNLSVEEQAAMFRKLMGRSQTGISADPVPYTAPPSTTKDPRGGRPVGRNRDADSIANASDLYFAQLKRDSNVRVVARINGEEDRSEAVFEDPGIEDLKELLHENPYLKEQKDAEKALVSMSPEEMLPPFERNTRTQEEKDTYRGISYKEKLMQKRKKHGGNAAANAAPPTRVEEPTAPVAAPEPVVSVSEPVEMSAPPAIVEQQLPQPTPVVRQVPVIPEPVMQSTPVLQAPAPAQPAASSGPLSPEEQRQNIRTTMGLLLKHRGGTGFGAGRIKGPEINRFEDVFEEVTAMLRDEAMQGTQSAAVQTANPAQVDSMIACIEGAILMYKNSPGELQESVLPLLRSALMSAVNTCNNLIAGDQVVSIPSSASGATQVDRMIACIEGATAMYKNSPPELQGSVLVTLRAALMSAVNECNKIIAEHEIANLEAYVAATGREVAPTPDAPVQFTDVMVDEVEEPVVQAPLAGQPAAPAVPTQSASTGMDPNSKVLQSVYDQIQAASGGGKLGLKEEMTADEAEALMNGIQDMRAILMEELESGIPDPEPTAATRASPKASGESSTASKYQEMLAKARVEKAGQ